MLKLIKRTITLTGIRPIMFDRYVSMNGQEIEPEKKFYLAGDGESLVFPAVNISSFLSADLTESATKRVMGKKWKTIAKAALSFTDIEPVEIPITREGQPLTLSNAGYVIDRRVARVKKSGGLVVPSEKVRPKINTPWEITFQLTLFDNPDLNESTLRKIFDGGGIAVGLGTFRGVYGKFVVSKWE